MNARAQTGIQTLRRKPEFTTPNVFAPIGFEPADRHERQTLLLEPEARSPEAGEVPAPRPDPEASNSKAGDRPQTEAAGPKTKDQRPKTKDLQHCYICKRKFTAIHFFYDQLCQGCAELNFAKARDGDLRGGSHCGRGRSRRYQDVSALAPRRRSSNRFPRALRAAIARARLPRGRPGRSSGSICDTRQRRGVLPDC